MQASLGSYDVIAFVATANPSKAKAFYGDVLGLRLLGDDDFALVFDANGTMVRVQIVKECTPAPYTALGWKVPDIHAAVTQIQHAGVRFERYPWMDQDEQGVWTSPSGAKIAWFKDPDGNVLSLTEF
jgi:catechol 2,3-dioxygenase-like lactoylglutathione lyase family enzyme